MAFLWRAAFNLLPLRGRKRRLAKLLVVLVLSAALSLAVLGGVCLPGVGRCGFEEKDRLERIRDFETNKDYELHRNPVLHRNIKGGQNPQPPETDSVPQPILDQSKTLDTVDSDEHRSQLHEPGHDLMSRDGEMAHRSPAEEEEGGVGAEKDGEVRSDDQKISKDQSLEDDRGPQEIEFDDLLESQLYQNEDEGMPVDGNGEDQENIFREEDEVRKSIKVAAAKQGTAGEVEKREGVLNEGGEQFPLETQREDEREAVVSKIKHEEPSTMTDGKPAAPGVESDTPRAGGTFSKKKIETSSAPALVTDSVSPSLSPGVVTKHKTKINVGGDHKQGGGVATEASVKSDGSEDVKGEGGVGSEAVRTKAGGGGGGGGGGEKEEKQMSAVEMARAIESGEMCKTVCPPFTWSEWSPCSKACGRGRRYRKALYKFICQSSELCPLNRIEETVCETPCKFDPDKYGGPNGLDMYPINPLNPAIYPEDRKYMCGHWLVEYEKLHQEILSGKRPPRYLVYSTGKGTYPTAGGIAPRIRGITTTFFLAVLLDRAFMIDWQDPPGLDLYLEPKSFDWADLSKLDSLKRGPIRDIGSWRSAKESSISSQWYMTTNFSTFFTNEVEVVQGHRYDFTYAVLRNPELMPKAYELGVDRIKCRICCAFHMLFRMTEKFQQQMDELLGSLGAPQKNVGAIQVRTKSNNVQDAVKYVDSFIKCASKAGKAAKLAGRISWVPIFNNRLVVHIVHKKYGDRLKIPINIDTATRTVHTHLGNLPADTELEVAKAVQERTFKEFFMTINSTVLIRKKGYEGSFGNIADAIRRFYHKLGTVHTFLVGNTCTKFPDTYKIE